MEEKVYRLLGVNLYRKFVVFVKKKYDQIRGKQETDNYFLKDYSIEGIQYLKEQLINNAKIHALGVMLGAIGLGYDGALWIRILVLWVLVHNLYCVMIQRYNLLRINSLLRRIELAKSK